jgi:hypothetical protein
MNPGALILVLSLLVIIILFSLFRRRGGPSKYPETVQAILWDVKINEVLANTIQVRPKPTPFETVNWQLYQKKMGFLEETLKQDLRESFELATKFNVDIRAARKAKSDSYKNLDLSRLKELLVKCRQELEDWMIKNTGSKELPPKYPTMSSFFFGDR